MVRKVNEDIEKDSETHSIEKNGQSVLKVRNALPYQSTFEAKQIRQLLSGRVVRRL